MSAPTPVTLSDSSHSTSSSSFLSYPTRHLTPPDEWRNSLQPSTRLSNHALAPDWLDEYFFTEEYPSSGPPITNLNIQADQMGLESLLEGLNTYPSRLTSVHTLQFLSPNPDSIPPLLDDQIISTIASGLPSLNELNVKPDAIINFTTSGAQTLKNLSSLRTLTLQVHSKQVPVGDDSASSENEVAAAVADINTLLTGISGLSQLECLSIAGEISGSCCNFSLLGSHADLGAGRGLTQLRSLSIHLYGHSSDGPVSLLTLDAARTIFTSNPRLVELSLGPLSPTEEILKLLPECAPNITKVECYDISNNVTDHGSPLLVVLPKLFQIERLTIDFGQPPTDSQLEGPLLEYCQRAPSTLRVLTLRSSNRLTDKVLQALCSSPAASGLRALNISASYGFSSVGIHALHALPQLVVLSVGLDHLWHRRITGDGGNKPDSDEELYSCFRGLHCVDLMICSSRSAGEPDYLMSPLVLPPNLLTLGLYGFAWKPPIASSTVNNSDSFRGVIRQVATLVSAFPLETLHYTFIEAIQEAAQNAPDDVSVQEWLIKFNDWLTKNTQPHFCQLRSSRKSYCELARFNQPKEKVRDELVHILNQP